MQNKKYSKLYVDGKLLTYPGQEVELHPMHKFFGLDILGKQILDQQKNFQCQDNLVFQKMNLSLQNKGEI